jgi:hypothetical protein
VRRPARRAASPGLGAGDAGRRWGRDSRRTPRDAVPDLLEIEQPVERSELVIGGHRPAAMSSSRSTALESRATRRVQWPRRGPGTASATIKLRAQEGEAGGSSRKRRVVGRPGMMGHVGTSRGLGRGRGGVDTARRPRV